MSPAWQSPALIPPVKVLRLTLRGPVTLGHMLLLEEWDSPVVTGEALTLGDLSLAVLICSTTVRRARWFLGWRFFGFRPAKWVLGGWGGCCGLLDFRAEAQRFSEWFGAQCGGPTPKVRQQSTSLKARAELAAPWYLHRLALALGELGLLQAEAEAMPVKRLAQLCAALAEARGQAEFWNTQEEAFYEDCQRMDLATLSHSNVN